MAKKTPATTSVIIPTYNGVGYLPDCLDSLKAQTLKPDEVILVDDDSTDATATLIKKSYPEIRYLRLESNQGFASAVNAGIRESKGTYIALLNNDTCARPEWLNELKRTLDDELAVGFCSSKMLFANRPDVINSIGIGFSPAGLAVDIGYGQKDGGRFSRPRPVFGACAGAAMYRRSLFDDIGLFDEDLFMWYEDADLSFRAQLAGYSCVYVPTAVIYHVGGGTESAESELHQHYCSRNQILVMVKNLPDPIRSRYLSRMAYICAKHAVKMTWERKPAVLRGYLAALRDLKLFMKKHKITSENTRVSADEILRLLTLNSEEIAAQEQEQSMMRSV